MDIVGSAAADATLTFKAEIGDFLALSMIGHEHLGRMYEYVIELAQVDAESGLPMAPPPEKPDLAKLIGTPAAMALKLAGDEKRYFHGYITRAKRGERHGRYTRYTLTLRPGIWFMTQTKNSRVYQEKSVKDVIDEILKEYNIAPTWKLDKPAVYPKLDYCVQYNETDFDFVHRLLEEVGIYYFFEHAEKSHKIILIDKMSLHEPHPLNVKISWRNVMATEPTIINWNVQQEVRSVKTVLTEYDFLTPANPIKGTNDVPKPPKKLGTMEWFEHPARVVQNAIKPEKQEAGEVATQRAAVRMEELQSLYATATGTTNVRDIGIGMTYEIEVGPNEKDNGKYLVASAVYRIDFGDYESVDDLKQEGTHEGYFCDFLSVSKDGQNYRTPRITPRPTIPGPQTAVVVGKQGNEIDTDKHGRVKVQFHWDRLGKKDEKSSCWVRVVQPWAGKGFGVIALPRLGDEVVVHFLDGDPDRPLVIGSLYNNDHMMAWTLPTQATVTGFKSRTSKGGDKTTANELRFEDLKDKEYVWFHAERDFHRQVEHDAFDWVGNNESVKVTLTRKEVIGENWFMDVAKDVMHNLGKDLHVKVAGDIFYTGGATFQLQLEKDFSIKAGGDLGADVGGKTQIKSTGDISIESTGKITLKGATIVIEGSGPVDIVGALVKVNSGGSGSPAQPTKPDEAKKEDSLTQGAYKDSFKDPLPDGDGGSGAAKSKT